MKLSKEEQARRDGMAYALKIAKEDGVDALEAEMKRRGISIAPCTLPQKELDEFTLKVKENTIDTITNMAAYILHDKYGFGKKRLEQFRWYLNDLADSIVCDYLTVEDIIEYIKEQTGVDLLMRKNDTNVRINR